MPRPLSTRSIDQAHNDISALDSSISWLENTVALNGQSRTATLPNGWCETPSQLVKFIREQEARLSCTETDAADLNACISAARSKLTEWQAMLKTGDDHTTLRQLGYWPNLSN